MKTMRLGMAAVALLSSTVIPLLIACSPQGEGRAGDRTASKPPEPPPVLKKWEVSTRVDSFKNESRTTAILDSENRQPVGFSGNQVSASIVIWKNPPPNVIVAKIYFSESAMPLGRNDDARCYSDDCDVYVKFDGGPIQKYTAFEPSSGSQRNQLFVNSKDFVTRALKAEKIELRANFYRTGKGDFNFRNEVPFSWDQAVLKN